MVCPTDLVLNYGWLPISRSSGPVLGWIAWLLIVIGILRYLRHPSDVGGLIVNCLLVLAPTSFIPMQDVIL